MYYCTLYHINIRQKFLAATEHEYDAFVYKTTKTSDTNGKEFFTILIKHVKEDQYIQ